jgi:transcriptional regulator with XRE-family HTH domain
VEYRAHRGKHGGVPNLSSQARDPALVALGAAIRRMREARDTSQEALALAAGVDRSYMGRVERGDNAIAVLTLVKVAGVLGTTASVLMEQAGL